LDGRGEGEDAGEEGEEVSHVDGRSSGLDAV
jgi:hypothetical protein